MGGVPCPDPSRDGLTAAPRQHYLGPRWLAPASPRPCLRRHRYNHKQPPKTGPYVTCNYRLLELTYRILTPQPDLPHRAIEIRIRLKLTQILGQPCKFHLRVLVLPFDRAEWAADNVTGMAAWDRSGDPKGNWRFLEGCMRLAVDARLGHHEFMIALYCRASTPRRIRFMYSVPLFLKQRCNRTPGGRLAAGDPERRDRELLLRLAVFRSGSNGP